MSRCHFFEYTLRTGSSPMTPLQNVIITKTSQDRELKWAESSGVEQPWRPLSRYLLQSSPAAAPARGTHQEFLPSRRSSSCPKSSGSQSTSANVLIKGLHGQDRWPKASAANDTSFCGWPANLLSTVMFFVGTVTLIVNGFHTVLDNCSSDVPETTRTCFVGTLKYSCEVCK
jgi:hypothetical protein